MTYSATAEEIKNFICGKQKESNREILPDITEDGAVKTIQETNQ